MDNKMLRPTNDLIFKMIFGDHKNTDILGDFLKSVLDLPESEYSKITIVDPNSRLEYVSDKTVILDVKLHTTTGKIIDIEIQMADVRQMKERIVYYTAKMITEQMSKSDHYNKIKKVISIVITDYKLITENEAYHNIYHLYDKKTGSTFSDVLEINTLELPKLPHDSDNSKLWNWLKFLKTNREEEYQMLAQESPQIKKAVGVLKELSHDERTRLLYEAREKARRDEEARMEYAVEQAEKRGEERGEERAELEIVNNLLKKNVPIDVIAECTELSYQEIKELAKKI